MRVLVLHSDVAPGAPPDELDTLVTAKAVADALKALGHEAFELAFDPEPSELKSAIANLRPDIVFNMVESVHGDGALAMLPPAMLEKLGVAYTGCNAACIAASGDKVLAKRMMRAAALPTGDWAEPPAWQGLRADQLYVVKSVTEDASLGLDDGAVVRGDAVPPRAHQSAEKYGGRWFAEAYLEGREFNVAVLEDEGGPRVLHIPEMRFVSWKEDRPRIVGYAAKWDESCADAKNTVRAFGIESEEPALAKSLADIALKTWHLLGMRGFARIDFRIDANERPMILEANPNPCLEPSAGFAAAAAQGGLSYAALIERILKSAETRCRI